MLANNRWMRSEGTLNEKPISIQYRQDWQLAKEAGEYSICIQIAWNANSSDDSSGFPAEDEQVEILMFHELLQAHVETNENALVLMMITHSGVNQWVVYAKDLERFKQDLESIPAREGGYPLEVVADMDEEWRIFTQVYQAIEQPA